MQCQGLRYFTRNPATELMTELMTELNAHEATARELPSSRRIQYARRSPAVALAEIIAGQSLLHQYRV